MKKVRITRSQLGAYVRKLLRENSTASSLITVNANSTSGVAGIDYNSRDQAIPMTISSPELSFNFLSMVSKGSIGTMGEVFEDIAQYVSLPKYVGGNFDNLNVTFAMKNSPAADIGQEFADSVEESDLPGDGKNYKLTGKAWSVKSTAGQSEGGFATLATAVGQLAACGLIKAKDISSVNLDSQPRCYLALSNTLNPGDSVEYEMGLCYYKFNRNGNITYEPTLGPGGNELFLYTLNSPAILETSSRPLGQVNFSSIVGGATPTSTKNFINYPFLPVGSCKNNTCYHVNSTRAIKTTAEIDSYLTERKLKSYTRSSKVPYNTAQPPKQTTTKAGAWTPNALNAIREYFISEHAHQTATGDFDYSQYDPSKSAGLSDNLLNAVTNKSDLDNINGAISLSVLNLLLSTFANKVFSAGNINSDLARSITTAYDNPEFTSGNISIPVDPDRMIEVVFGVYGTTGNLLKTAIDFMPTYDSIKNDLKKLIDQNTGLINKTYKKYASKFLKDIIDIVRRAQPEFLTLKRIMMPVIDLSADPQSPSFEFKYIEPVTFKITRLEDMTMSEEKDGTTTNKTFNMYSVTNPDNTATIIRADGSKVEVSQGRQASVSHSPETWGTSYESTPGNLNLKIGAASGLDITGILKYSEAEIELAIEEQQRVIENLINAQRAAVSSTPSSQPNQNPLAGVSSQIVSPTDLQKAETELFTTSQGGGLSNLRFRLFGELLTLEQAKEVLDINAQKVEELGKIPVRIKYDASQHLTFVVKQLSYYQEILQSSLGGYRPTETDVNKMFEEAVQQFATSIFALLRTAATQTDSQARAQLKSNIRILIDYVSLKDDPVAIEIINQMVQAATDSDSNSEYGARWINNQFLIERMQSSSEIDLTHIYYFIRSLLYFGLAIKAREVLGDELGITRIANLLKGHIAAIETNMQPQQPEIGIAAESRLYKSILSDLKEAARQKRRAQLSNLDEQKLRRLIRHKLKNKKM